MSLDVSCHGNAMSRLVEIRRDLHGKLWYLTHEILCGTTCIHACNNEVIIERYRTSERETFDELLA